MMYRDAVQPAKMIQIIADLTMSNKATVSEFLGLPEKQPPKRIDPDRALELYNKGLCDSEIAKEFGTTRNAVTVWRKKNSLPLNVKVKRGESV